MKFIMRREVTKVRDRFSKTQLTVYCVTVHITGKYKSI